MGTTVIRKAQMQDRQGIHEAHMRSIREVCVRDHGPDEVKGWGNRPLGDRWVTGINQGLVWVVEHQGKVAGLASVALSADQTVAHIQALYLTPEVLGLGLGGKLLALMIEESKSRGVQTVTLESSITAHGFYLKYGFSDAGPVGKSPIGGSMVTSYPMRMTLSPPAGGDGRAGGC